MFWKVKKKITEEKPARSPWLQPWEKGCKTKFTGWPATKTNDLSPQSQLWEGLLSCQCAICHQLNLTGGPSVADRSCLALFCEGWVSSECLKNCRQGFPQRHHSNHRFLPPTKTSCYLQSIPGLVFLLWPIGCVKAVAKTGGNSFSVWTRSSSRLSYSWNH